MGTSAEALVVVRRARPADEAARLQLLAATYAETRFEAFLYFFFQELTLQAVVLAGAVLFIFCGVSAAGCALALPAAAAAVWLGVWLHSLNTINNLHQHLREEVAGWVAELTGPLIMGPLGNTTVVVQHEHSERDNLGFAHKEVVGTVSLSRRRGDSGCGREGWVRALGVAGRARRRGAGRALLAALRAHALAAGYSALHTVTSHLQPEARTMLHSLGWECRGAYQRPLLGAALSLPLAHLALDLPHA